MQLFYAPKVEGKQLVLPESDSKHAIRVLRKVVGDTIHVVDGIGSLYTCKISDANPKAAALDIISHEPNYQPLPYHLHIAIAPTKNMDRIEWFVEKAIEIGVHELSFIKCAHSERRHFKLDRIQKVAISAMKQSVKAFLPKMNDFQNVSDVIKSANTEAKCIAFVDHGNEKTLSSCVKPNGSHIILIGPEGDFNEQEVSLAKEHGFDQVNLGPSRLRTETAGVAASHTVYLAHL